MIISKYVHVYMLCKDIGHWALNERASCALFVRLFAAGVARRPKVHHAHGLLDRQQVHALPGFRQGEAP